MSRKIKRTCVVDREPVNVVTILKKSKGFQGITQGDSFGAKAREALKDTKVADYSGDSYGFGSAPSFSTESLGGTIPSDPDAYSKILNPGMRQTSKKTQRYARQMFKSNRKGRKHHPKVSEDTVAKYHKMKRGGDKAAKLAAKQKAERPGPALGVYYSSPFSLEGGGAQLGYVYQNAKDAFKAFQNGRITLASIARFLDFRG